MRCTVSLAIETACSREDLAIVRNLLREYANSLEVDLCFQGFEAELAGLPGAYATPHGCLLLASVDGRAAGCAALRPHGAGSGEMKRLYVRPEFQGQGIGRSLAKAVIEQARVIGYGSLLLDTLPSMAGALRLYESLGFVRRPAYYETPVPGNVFMERSLR